MICNVRVVFSHRATLNPLQNQPDGLCQKEVSVSDKTTCFEIENREIEIVYIHSVHHPDETYKALKHIYYIDLCYILQNIQK